MFGALKRGRFRSMASLILVVNVVDELQRKRTLAPSRGFLAAARLSCSYWRLISVTIRICWISHQSLREAHCASAFMNADER